MRTVSPLMTSPTTSMTANVSKYCVSATAKVREGGTKKKSKAATLMTEATTEGPRPCLVAMTTTASRYVMIRLASSKNGNIIQERPVANMTAATASAYPAPVQALVGRRTDGPGRSWLTSGV